MHKIIFYLTQYVKRQVNTYPTQEMINQIRRELMELPPRIAYVYIRQERGVRVVKIRTLSIDRDYPQRPSLKGEIEERSLGVYTPYALIDQDIKNRQAQWRKGLPAKPSQPALPSASVEREPEAPPPTVERSGKAKARPETPPAQRPVPAIRQPSGLAVESLKFFEEGEDPCPPALRRYSTRFARRDARYISYEPTMKNLERQSPRTYHVTVRYYNPDGSLLWEGLHEWHIEPTDDRFAYPYGTGWPDPGHWKEGTYRVELMIDGGTVAQGAFTIE